MDAGMLVELIKSLGMPGALLVVILWKIEPYLKDFITEARQTRELILTQNEILRAIRQDQVAEHAGSRHAAERIRRETANGGG